MAEGSFRFLALPSEIRNEIYHLLLPDNKTFLLAADHLRRERRKPQVVAVRSLTRLICASRQILQEAAPVLYGNMIWSLYFDPEDVRLLR